MVTVRLFASLRAAAGGRGYAEVAATSPSGIAAALIDAHGEVMAARLSVATLLVDGDVVPLDDSRDLTAATEIVLVPPFSGG